MSDTNHHVLTGKVDITSNLLVGSSHLFVDTENNRVGLVTANPQAGLHVNSNAYVNTDLRVGPAGPNQVVINATAGRIKAASFEGDGSLLQNTPPGADGAAATIEGVTVTTGAAGSSASVTNSGTTSAAVFDFVIPRGDQGIQGIPGNDGAPGADGADGTNYFTESGLNIYRSTGNVGIGTVSPQTLLHIETPTGTASNYVRIGSYMNNGSSQSISGIEFRTNPQFHNNDNIQRVPAQIRSGFYDGGSADWTDAYISFLTPNSPSDGALVDALTVRGGKVGVGTASPTRELDVAGNINLNGVGRTIYFDATGGSGLYWGGGYSRIVDDGDLRICTDDNMHFNTGCSSTTLGTERMVIKSDGNVGIGVANPDEKLHVNGNIAVHWQNNARMIMNYDNSYRQGIELDAGSRTMKLFSTTADTGGDIAFYTRNGAGSSDTDYGTERMRIRANGNIDFKPASSGSYTLMNFWSNVNYGSDRGFILVQDESANLPGSSSEDLRMTVGVHNDFRSSGLHSDELWLQGGGRLCYNVGAWDSELNSIIGTPGTGSDHGGVKHEWRIANSQKMSLNSSGTLNVSGEIEAAAFTTKNTGSFSYNWDGVFMRPDGQVYISVDDNFYFRDNASTSSNRSHLFDTNAGHAYHEGTMYQNYGLDYAEYFEWFDGNPDGEDRIGYSVSLVENTNKIKKCEPGEIPLGVVSGTSSVVGGVAGIYWTGYWKNDEWGRPTYRQLKDDNGELVFNEDGTPKMKRAKNPEYDETLSDTYLPRNKRNEWACVGLLGQVYIRKGCIRSPYWRKIKNVDDVKEYWFINPVFPDTQALDELKKDLQSEKEKVATMELLVASLVKRVGDLENLVI
jgi:hypothetical protein